MPLPPIKRSTANLLAKSIRNGKLVYAEEIAKFLAKFFQEQDPTFRADIFYKVASGKMETDPAIKNPNGNNQWSNK